MQCCTLSELVRFLVQGSTLTIPATPFPERTTATSMWYHGIAENPTNCQFKEETNEIHYDIHHAIHITTTYSNNSSGKPPPLKNPRPCFREKKQQRPPPHRGGKPRHEVEACTASMRVEPLWDGICFVPQDVGWKAKVLHRGLHALAGPSGRAL